MRALVVLGLGLGLALAGSTTAHADGIQKDGPEEFPGKHELSASLGYQFGFGGKVGSPDGARLTAEYAYRFHPIVWFDVQLGQVFGAGPRTDACPGNAQQLCYRGGWASELAVGVKVKIPTRIPVVVEIPILLGIVGLYDRACADDAVGIPVGRTGVGVKYFIQKWVGVGANIDFDFGPAFHQATACKAGGRYTDLYGAFGFNIGAEFIL
jgi:hypothetical protein